MKFIGTNKRYGDDCNYCGCHCAKGNGKLYLLDSGRYLVVHKDCHAEWRSVRRQANTENTNPRKEH